MQVIERSEKRPDKIMQREQPEMNEEPEQEPGNPVCDAATEGSGRKYQDLCRYIYGYRIHTLHFLQYRNVYMFITCTYVNI